LAEAVEIMRWKDYRRLYKWREADGSGWGQHVLEYPRMDSGSISGEMIVLLPGQATDLCSEETDTVYLGVEGEVEFSMGEARAGLAALDLLGLPRGTAYRFANSGLSNALVFCMKNSSAPRTTSMTEGNIGQSAPYISMRWQDYRSGFRWTLPFAETWGFHRGAGPHMRLDTLSGHTVRHPIGQCSPWHAAQRDLLFIQLSGTSAFQSAGKVWELEARDLLLIRARTPYSYANIELSESVFLDMGVRITQGSTYYAEDPGWPIRSDARILETEKDTHGHARLKGGTLPARPAI